MSWYLQVPGDNPVVFAKSRLRAGIKTSGPRGQHHVLKKHSIIEPTSLPHDPVDGEEESHRCIEEGIVSGKLLFHALALPFGNPENPVEVVANLASPIDVGRHPFVRVVGVFLRVLRISDGIECGFDELLGESFLFLTRDDNDLPRLGICPGGGTCRDIQNLQNPDKP